MNTESILPMLGELFVKSALTTLAAVLLIRAWRGATAAQRHLIWLVALATVMLLPLTRLVTPFWRIPVSLAKPATVVKLEPLLVPMIPVEMDSSAKPITKPASVWAPLDWRKLLLGTWLSGTALLLGYRLFGSWRLHRLMRRSTPVDDPRIRLLLSRTLSELHLHRRPEIRLSDECRVPITWGSLRPVMLLPQAALQWRDTWILAALRHEAAHISRYDYLTRWFAQAACALYWPNPLVWLLARSLRIAQELAADDLVLRAGTPADEYASQLVEAAREITTHGFFVRQAVAMACPSTLEDRVRAIVDGRRDRRPLSRLAATCGSFAIASVLGLSTAAQLRSDEQKPDSETKDAEVKPSRPVGPQIEIEAKFIQIDSPAAQVADVQTGSADVPADKPAIFTDPQFQVIIRALSQKKGVDMLSAPRVTTLPNQRAVVEVVHEMRTPTDWEKDGDIWKPTKFETKNLGVTLEVEPRLTKAGAIELHTVSSVVEFLGFLDLDTGKTIPAGHYGVHEPQVPPVVPGHRSKGIYSERKKENNITLKSGETLQIADLPETADTKAFEKNGPRNRIIVFVSPRLIAPAPAAAQAEPAATAAPARSTAAITLDKAGSLKLNGEPVTIEELKTRLQALKAASPDGLDATVRAAEDIPYREVVSLLDAIREAGITNVGLAKRPAAEEGAANPPPTGQNTLTFQNGSSASLGTANTLTLSGGTLVLSRGANPGTATDASTTPSGTLDFARGTTLVLNNNGQRAGGETLVSAENPNVAKGDTDTEFLRRAYLNIAGRPPTPEELRAFLDDPRPSAEKRKAAVETIAASGNATNANDGARTVAALDSPAFAKATKIIIPKIDFREVTLEDALEFLRRKAVELDPDKTGVKIGIKPGTESEARITMDLTNVPLIDALKYVTGLCDLKFVVTPEALIVQPMNGRASGASSVPPPRPGAVAAPVPQEASKPEKPVEIQADKTHMENGIAIAEGHAHLRFGKYDIQADTIRYDPGTHSVGLFGHTEVKDGVNLVRGEEIDVNFDTGSIQIQGPHRTSIPEPNPPTPK